MTKKTTVDGVIRAITCYTINCADCGENCWEDRDFTPHFTSENELRQRVSDYGWTHDPHDRWLCDRCTQAADCVRDGHQWGEWELSPRDLGVVWRVCGHCGRADESLTALLPGGGAG